MSIKTKHYLIICGYSKDVSVGYVVEANSKTHAVKVFREQYPKVKAPIISVELMSDEEYEGLSGSFGHAQTFYIEKNGTRKE